VITKKELVASELPSKSEIVKYTQFSTKQTALYESIRVTMDKKVREAVAKKGIYDKDGGKDDLKFNADELMELLK
jgi:SNF2 family DNA or RNA helicase